MNLPEKPGPDRDAAILQYIRGGNYDVSWAQLVAGPVSINVFADALKIDGIRINVSALLQQQIADLLGCMLLTPKIADLLYAARAVTLDPSPQSIDASTTAMIVHSKRVDDALAAAGGVGPGGIVQTSGKHWVIANALEAHPGRAENYGWHFAGATFGGSSWEGAVTPGMRLIQGQGWAHDMSHVDYSQTCFLMHRACIVNGTPMDLAAVLTDADLASNLSHEGPLRVLRQPGVPTLQGAVAMRIPPGTGLVVGAVVGGAVGGLPGAVAGGIAGYAIDIYRGKKV
jgi:hypothetical protein